MSENATPHYPDLYDASIAELNQGLNSGLFSSLDLTKAYLARISEVNPQVHAVIETNPRALEYAAALDTERAERGPRGPLHGIPILLKDNITSDPGDGMQSTAGSFALLGAVSHRPAFITSRLIAAGAIILGKANLSEWAMFRGANPSGWSGRGGQTTNPYVPNGDPGGSSSGSGVAAAIGLAAACVGTETDGSIISPSRRNNIVGLKPTVGLTSRDGVIPVSFTQDSVGPMARYVSDVALLLSAMAGQDSRDAYTLYQPTPLPDYTTFLSSEALRGARIGVPRALLAPAEKLESDIQNFEDALRILQTLGAELIDDVSMPAILGLGERIGLLPSELRVVETEFRPGFEKYVSELREVPTGVRTVEDLIEFNEKHADKELILPHYASQSRLISCKSLVMDDEYRKAVQDGYKVGRTDGIDAALIKYKLDALVLPADGNFNASAVAGYPILTVPLGSRSANTPVRPGDGPLIDIAPNLPTGLAFFGGAWSEAKLLAYGYAFEQATLARKKTKAYKEATPRTGLEAILKM